MKIFKSFQQWRYRVRYNTEEFKKFKSWVINFYDGYNENEYHFNTYRITKFRLYNYPKHILVEIHSLSPGMIIGKSGKCLDDFTAYLQKRFSKPIKIILEETNPFK
jgi:ribosomal protein S3